MEHFPDRAVQEIVDGLEAARRILNAMLDPEAETGKDALLAEERVIANAEERIRTLRIARSSDPLCGRCGFGRAVHLTGIPFEQLGSRRPCQEFLPSQEAPCPQN